MPSWMNSARFLLVTLATGALATSDALGIEHGTIVKTIAGALLALFAGEAAHANATGAAAAKDAATATGNPQ